MKSVSMLCAIFLLVSASVAQEINYTLAIENPHRNEFEVQIDYTLTDENHVGFVMPAWTPGYYSIQNLAKNVFDVQATDPSGNKLPFQKVDKQTWRVGTNNVKKVSLQYKVYAYSRGNPYSLHVDPEFAFYNGAFVFMYVKGEKSTPIKVKFNYPKDWDSHTSIQDQLGADTYLSPDYDTFIDSPSFFGKLEKFSFTVKNKPHYVVMNAGYEYNQPQITKDLTKLVNWFAGLFGELPYKHYTFFLRIANPGKGGIEHLNSNVSCVVPEALSGNPESPKYYSNFLMLEAHEFFHTYNVKRIHPTGLGPFDYTREVYTKLLWFCEGFTSYYTHRPLVKAGIIEPDKIYPSWASYYNDLVQNAVLYIKPLAQYSFDSWIADSDIPDYTFRVFYRKGAFIAMLLDIEMRLRTDHQKTMDGFFRFLYQDVYKNGETFTLAGFLQLLNHYAAKDYSQFFDKYVTGLDTLPIREYLAKVGLDLKPVEKLPYLGIEQKENAGEAVEVYYVHPGSPADKLKMSRGDRIVSVNDQKVNKGDWSHILKSVAIGEPVEFSWFHKEKLHSDEIVIPATKARTYTLWEREDITEKQKDFLKTWLLP